MNLIKLVLVSVHWVACECRRWNIWFLNCEFSSPAL